MTIKKNMNIKLNNIIEENNEYKKIMQIKVNNLIEEKKEMKNKIEELSKENNLIKKELEQLNDKLNIILDKKDNNNNKIHFLKSAIKKNIKMNRFYTMTQKELELKSKDKLEPFEYNYDLIIYLKERKNEILIYDKNNKFIKKLLKPENFKNCEKFDVFPFKSKFLNLGKSLLLTGGIINEQKSKKCYLISAIEAKSNIETYEINITSYGDLKEKRGNHNIIYLPDKNWVFVCSGYLTKSCEYTDILKKNCEEIKPLNKIRFNASMAYINKRYVYIFFGSLEENEKSIYLNDMEYFDLNNFEKGWTTLNYINDKEYELSLCAVGVIPVSKNEFLICGGYDGNKYKSKTYKINCNDHEHPIIEDININNAAIFIHNLFCKIGDAYFNFDLSAKLFRFDYKKMNIGVFFENQTKK